MGFIDNGYMARRRLAFTVFPDIEKGGGDDGVDGWIYGL